MEYHHGERDLQQAQHGHPHHPPVHILQDGGSRCHSASSILSRSFFAGKLTHATREFVEILKRICITLNMNN